MHIAILTFQGFNELDSFIALGVLNRIKKPDWRVELDSLSGISRHRLALDEPQAC